MLQSASSRTDDKIVIVGGDSAGIAVASRLRRADEADVALLDPARTHYSTTARNKVPLAELDTTMEPKHPLSVIDTAKERKGMWLLKKYGLPALYWSRMFKGRA